MNTLHPHSARDVRDALSEASAARTRLLTVGGRTHIDKGNPSDTDAELWTTLLDDVVAYDPAEMLIVVEAGIRVGALQAVLAEGGQEWAVDAPPDATVGGVIAAGHEPVRRLRVGAMRDTVVEMELVTGDGRLIKSGARTVKNVTGFDVHRLLTGSLGTLGVIVQVALKVRPLPHLSRTLVADVGGVAEAERVLDGVPLPAAVIAGHDRVMLRLEGWLGEVDEQEAAARMLAEWTVDEAPFRPPTFPDAPILAEASVAPSQLDPLLEGRAAWRALAGVGTAWVPCESEQDLEALRSRAARLGGIAPVLRGPGGLGHAELPGDEIHRRLKAAFDPADIMAPGRFWDTR